MVMVRVDFKLLRSLKHLKTRVMGYQFTAVWVKGKENRVPDALPHHPVVDPNHMNILQNKTRMVSVQCPL